MRRIAIYSLAFLAILTISSCGNKSNPASDIPGTGQDTININPIDTVVTPITPPVNKIDSIVTPGSQDSLLIDSITSNNTGIIANFGQNIDVGMISSDTVALRNIGGFITVDTIKSDSAAISATGGSACSVAVSFLEAGTSNILTSGSGFVEIDSAMADSMSILTSNSGRVQVNSYLNVQRLETTIKNSSTIDVGNAVVGSATINMQSSGAMSFDTIEASSQVNIVSGNSGTLEIGHMTAPAILIDAQEGSQTTIPSLQAQKVIISGTTGNVNIGMAQIDTLLIQVGGLAVVAWDDGIPIIAEVAGGQWQGFVTIDSLVATYVVVAIRGSGEIEIKNGTTTGQTIDMRSSGAYLGGGFTSGNSIVKMAGAAEATVRVTNILDVTKTESARVSYYGNPTITSNVVNDPRLIDLDP